MVGHAKSTSNCSLAVKSTRVASATGLVPSTGACEFWFFRSFLLCYFIRFNFSIKRLEIERLVECKVSNCSTVTTTASTTSTTLPTSTTSTIAPPAPGPADHTQVETSVEIVMMVLLMLLCFMLGFFGCSWARHHGYVSRPCTGLTWSCADSAGGSGISTGDVEDARTG